MPQSAKPSSPLARAWKRLTASQTELAHDDLAAEAQRAGASPVAECTVRSRVVLQGQISMVAVSPRSARRWLEVSLDDGTGVVTLIWMGRREIPGIEPGRRLRVEGRLADDNGRRVIYNPQYELLD
ncbi:OB-fold nucleic acid binding domain-containing protein [Aestuariimicrobium ganziense]|uniref:OB-fold nucleic acid binding domain-containing protein n=1 Tax=Aestuariimicrobium ganziense TaxID=2773677 RepID=UPI001940D8A5|nr:OB-fold nucleic acid binding domain-containing protein [Aestuariimicrobium ganziense]